MKKLKKLVLLFVVFVMAAVSVPQLLGCVTPQEPDFKEELVGGEPYGIFTEKDFLKADGALIKNDYGTGEKVMLRGINAGGYLVLEQWMTAIEVSDHKTITEQMVERFGIQDTLRLWKYYRDLYWTDEDFQNCADMGMNVIRLPFTYMSVDPEFSNINAVEGQRYNFVLLDNFIKRAAKFGIYTMLDLHGAYGSQNGEHHSGQVISKIEDVDFFSNEESMQKTIDLWSALATHYKDNPAVCGYDILNEPIEKAKGSTTKRHFDFFDRVYKAIRLVDESHIVIFESCWGGGDLPRPSEYGWENCMYSFHHYTGTSDSQAHMKDMMNRLQEVSSRNFGVPIHMGEFTAYANEDSWTGTLSLLNARGWHWNTWTYKINRDNNTRYAGWGVYYTNAEKIVLKADEKKPDAVIDSFDSVKAKWARIKTVSKLASVDENSDDAKVQIPLQVFESGVTLFDIMKEYCKN